MNRRNAIVNDLKTILATISGFPVTYCDEIGEYKVNQINIFESDFEAEIVHKNTLISEPYALDITIAQYGSSSSDAAMKANNLLETIMERLLLSNNLGGEGVKIDYLKSIEREIRGKCVLSRLTIKTTIIYELPLYEHN